VALFPVYCVVKSNEMKAIPANYVPVIFGHNSDLIG